MPILATLCCLTCCSTLGAPAALAPQPSAPAAPVLQDSAPAAAPAGLTQAELTKIAGEIEADVARLRGHAFARPVEARLADKASFLEYAKAREARTTTPGKMRAEELSWKLLGVLAPDYDLRSALLRILESQVGGFYDPQKGSFCLMEGFTGNLARVVLAHELTHALDDQLHDIDRALDQRANDSDRQLAYMAVVEGSGTAIMQLWAKKALADKRISTADLANAPGMDSPELAAAPEALWKPLVFSYLQGVQFLAKGHNAIDAAFDAPPRSTEQVLHPEKYWEAAQRDEPRTVALALPELPAGWELIGSDCLGELGTALFATPADKRARFDPADPFALLGLRYTNDAARGWDGDRTLLLERGAARVLHWASVWDTPEDAQQFCDAVEAARASIGSGARGLAGDRAELSGLSIERPSPDRVLLTIWSGVELSEVEALSRPLVCTVGADPVANAAAAPPEAR